METKSGDDARVACPLFQEEYGGSIPTSPLQLRIDKINHIEAQRLNELWHSRMPRITPASLCYPCFVAQHANMFYAVAMWSYPIAANRIKGGEKCLELRRMTIAPDAPKNTASRMLSIMKNIIHKEMPNIERLISYQDTGVHAGTIYKASGWIACARSEFTSWKSHKGQFSTSQLLKEQSMCAKVRWEYSFK